jgi:hypothetical protein
MISSVAPRATATAGSTRALIREFDRHTVQDPAWPGLCEGVGSSRDPVSVFWSRALSPWGSEQDRLGCKFPTVGNLSFDYPIGDRKQLRWNYQFKRSCRLEI